MADRHTIQVSYFAQELASGKFTGTAVLTWHVRNNTFERPFHFPEEFDTAEDAAAHAETALPKRLEELG